MAHSLPPQSHISSSTTPPSTPSTPTIGIYYDKFDVYASTMARKSLCLSSSYQGHKDITIWSSFLCKNAVPVALYVGVLMNQDQMAATVMVNVKVDGRIRWKVGSFISGKYNLHANCPDYINVSGGRSKGVSVGPAAAKYQLVLECHVDV
ncbi:hypothetical protein BUALT_Bualt02G0020700 [Buddleja alternifolia]|uniref:NDR1/HIN1-like protein 1 n=1 Tax=Buddleja alternifolia TaxID=168488 RepID=A0AAV6XWV1_9LAMI|nr:hypothetical protein BUALT_Bualt02G0020700 [Buddleja alternifolia]